MENYDGAYITKVFLCRFLKNLIEIITIVLNLYRINNVLKSMMLCSKYYFVRGHRLE